MAQYKMLGNELEILLQTPTPEARHSFHATPMDKQMRPPGVPTNRRMDRTAPVFLILFMSIAAMELSRRRIRLRVAVFAKSISPTLCVDSLT